MRRVNAVFGIFGIRNTFGKPFEHFVVCNKFVSVFVIFLEPFLLPAPDKLRMRKLFNEELAVINKLALKYADEFVAYDEMFKGLAESL